MVAFAHGSGSGRLSPRNQYVARVLQEAGLATLLLDLLEQDEAEDRRKVFDIELLADRLRAAADWLARDRGDASAPAGLLRRQHRLPRRPWWRRPGSRKPSGRSSPAAAGPTWPGTTCRPSPPPPCCIVGGADEQVLDLNRRALERLRCPKELVVVPGATHLFPEPGALEEVARLATRWFRRHLQGTARSPGEEDTGRD